MVASERSHQSIFASHRMKRHESVSRSPRRCALHMRTNRSRMIIRTSALSRESHKLQIKQGVAMFASGAVLGPLCDSLHSAAGVLHYARPTIRSMGPLEIETCWWAV